MSGLAVLCGVVGTACVLAPSQAAATSASVARVSGLTQPADRMSDRPVALTASAGRAAVAAATGWAAIPNLPIPIEDNTVGVNNGTVYSVLGGTGDINKAGISYVSNLYSFKPGQKSWVRLANAPLARTQASGAFIGGRFYVTDGWDANDNRLGETDVYDPATNKWTYASPDPAPVAEAATTVLNGKLYVIGGCGADNQCVGVQIYDPATNSWSTAANYPETVSLGACAAISGRIYCAGGVSHTASITHAYVYDPNTNAWSSVADMPIDLFGSAYAAGNGQLLVQNGVTDDGLVETNQGVAYNPVTNAWSALPNALVPHFRGGSSAGFYQVGGAPNFTGTMENSEVLATVEAP